MTMLGEMLAKEGSRNCSQEGLKLAYQTAEIAVD